MTFCDHDLRTKHHAIHQTPSAYMLGLITSLSMLLAACGGGTAPAPPDKSAEVADMASVADMAAAVDMSDERDASPLAEDMGEGPAAARDAGDDTLESVVRLDASYEVEVTTHTYGRGLTHDDWMGEVTGAVDLVLDLYEPVDAPDSRPAVIVIHGGGFVGGSRNNTNSEGFARYFAERGFVAVNIDYRIADDFGTVPRGWFDLIEAQGLSNKKRSQALALYPAARDAKAAARWLHAHAESYSIDTERVTSIGGSAGSYLAVMLGVTDPADFRDELTVEEDSSLSTTNLDARSDVHVIIDHWGGVTHMELLEALDGRSRFDATDAPVSIVHGTDDPTVPFSEAEKLRDAYTQTGVAHDFHPIEGGGHGIWGTILDGQTLQQVAFDFVITHQDLMIAP